MGIFFSSQKGKGCSESGGRNIDPTSHLNVLSWGTWVAQSVKGPTSAQVMISQFMGSSPTSGSAGTAESQEPVSDSMSPSLCPYPTHALSLSQN